MDSSELPQDFDPSMFLYLNPDVVVRSSDPVTTVEDAIARYPTEFSDKLYRIPENTIEGPFLSGLYVSDNRDELDISALNRIVVRAIETQTGQPVESKDGHFGEHQFEGHDG